MRSIMAPISRCTLVIIKTCINANVTKKMKESQQTEVTTRHMEQMKQPSDEKEEENSLHEFICVTEGRNERLRKELLRAKNLIKRGS